MEISAKYSYPAFSRKSLVQEQKPLWYYKLTRIEFWPTWLLFLPQFFIFFWYAVTRFKLTYFTATNPGIYLSGLYGESKKEILDLIPQHLVPKTIFIEPNRSFDFIVKSIENNDINYPLICKPDAGGRGVGVAVIKNENELKQYFQHVNHTILIQEFIDLPFEAGVFFCASPTQKYFNITSLTFKHFLSVKGNGHSTVAELLEKEFRGKMQIARLANSQPELLRTIPENNKTILIEPIGNHCRGTEFTDGHAQISREMEASFHKIVNQIEGVYYGRFDLKFKDLSSLEKGEFQVMELNGLTAEPTHIYDPGSSLWKAWKTVAEHTSVMMKISAENIRLGHKPASIKEVWACVKQQFFTS